MQENKMGVMPVKRLVVSMAFPLMVSNFVQALYNVVDSIYVSRITTDEQIFDESGNLISAGTDAISALGLAFPVQLIIVALGIGTSVGVSSVLSRSLGEKHQKQADDAAANGLFLMIISYLISFIIGVFFAKAVIAGQGATGRKLIYGTSYLRIICLCSFAMYFEVMLERLLQSTGRTNLSMIPQLSGAIINVIMDPVLIFGFRMGVNGAAFATVFGQLVACAIGLFLNLKKNPEIHLKLKGFRPDPVIIGMIYTVGIPAILMQAVGSVMNFGMNKILLGLDESAVAVFTVYYKLQSFFFMPIFGLGSALVPILAYNYGAKNSKRMLGAYRFALLFGFSIIMVGFLMFELIPGPLIKIFDTGDPQLYAIGIPALRKIGCHYLFAWYCIVTGSVFQAVGIGVYSMIVSLARQLVVLLPAAYILGKTGGIAQVWWCFPIAECMSLMATLYFYIRVYQKQIRPLEKTKT